MYSMPLYEEERDIILKKYSLKPVGECFFEKSVFKQEVPEIDLSIIVPCYNAQEYVCTCLDSLVQQKTDISYEILVIDDGSTDNTGDILARYSDKNHRMRIITQENKGYSGARNSGIIASKGKYLMFVDSDDYVTSGYIENLMSTALKKNADIVACGYFTFRGNKVYKKISANGECDRKLLNGCFWGKVFRREIFSHIILPEGYWFEDSILAHLIYPKITSFYSVDGCMYAYRSNPQGITISSRGKAKSIDTFYITDLMIKSVEKVLSQEYLLSYDYYELLIEQFYLNQRRLRKNPEEVQREVFKRQSMFINKYYSDYRTNQSVRKVYERALRNNSYQESVNCIRLDKLYKLIDRISKK